LTDWEHVERPREQLGAMLQDKVRLRPD